jgi:hypothetical protein
LFIIFFVFLPQRNNLKMDAQHGTSVAKRRALNRRRSTNALAANMYRGDAALAFALNRADPDTRFSCLDQIGPLELIGQFVNANAPELYAYNRATKRILRHNLARASAAWVCAHQLVDRDFSDPLFFRQRLNCGTAFNRTELLIGDACHGIYHRFNRRTRTLTNAEDSFYTKYEAFYPVDYQQRHFLDSSNNLVTPTSVIRLDLPYSLGTNSHNYSRRFSVAYLSSVNTVFKVEDTSTQFCRVSPYLLPNRWTLANNLRFEEHTRLDVAATDPAGVLLYAFGNNTLYFYDVRAPPHWNLCGECHVSRHSDYKEPESPYTNHQLLPYNDGLDLLCFVETGRSPTFWHYSVRAGRWENTLIPQADDEGIYSNRRYYILDN